MASHLSQHPRPAMNSNDFRQSSEAERQALFDVLSNTHGILLYQERETVKKAFLKWNTGYTFTGSPIYKKNKQLCKEIGALMDGHESWSNVSALPSLPSMAEVAVILFAGKFMDSFPIPPPRRGGARWEDMYVKSVLEPAGLGFLVFDPFHSTDKRFYTEMPSFWRGYAFNTAENYPEYQPASAVSVAPAGPAAAAPAAAAVQPAPTMPAPLPTMVPSNNFIDPVPLGWSEDPIAQPAPTMPGPFPTMVPSNNFIDPGSLAWSDNFVATPAPAVPPPFFTSALNLIDRYLLFIDPVLLDSSDVPVIQPDPTMPWPLTFTAPSDNLIDPVDVADQDANWAPMTPTAPMTPSSYPDPEDTLNRVYCYPSP